MKILGYAACVVVGATLGAAGAVLFLRRLWKDAQL